MYEGYLSKCGPADYKIILSNGSILHWRISRPFSPATTVIQRPDLYIVQVATVFSSVCEIPYNIGHHIVNRSVMVGTCHSDMHHLTLTSCLWSSVVFHEGFLIKLISPLLYHLGSPYVINIFIIIGTF